MATPEDTAGAQWRAFCAAATEGNVSELERMLDEAPGLALVWIQERFLFTSDCLHP